jgi:acyl-coenzyme A thioesterase PaaI-like protein
VNPASPGVEVVDALRSFVEEGTPHNRALGVRLVDAGPAGVVCTVPHSQVPAGDVETGEMDEGVLATLMDVTCGSAVCVRLGRLQRMATLELRIDFVRSPRPGRLLIAEGQCYGVRRSVAFVRALAHDGDRGDVVACAQGTFILAGE